MESSGAFLPDIAKCLRIFLGEHKYQCRVRAHGPTWPPGPGKAIGLKVIPADYYHGDFVDIIIKPDGGMKWQSKKAGDKSHPMVPLFRAQHSNIYREDALPRLLEFLDKAFCRA